MLATILVAGAVYAGGLAELSRRGRPGPERWRVACFYGGLLVAFLALASPLDALSHDLFMMHMTQHMLLVLVVAPLVLLGAPVVPLLRGLPPPFRRVVLAPVMRQRWVRRVFRFLASPIPAFVIYTGVFAVWHAPALYDTTLSSDIAHSLQHASFMACALLFWWNVIDPLPYRGNLPEPVKLLYLFVGSLPQAVLGMMLTFADAAWYTPYTEIPRLWGVSARDDQSMGGVIMWVPGSIVYLLAICAVALFMVIRQEKEEDAEAALPDSPDDAPGSNDAYAKG